MLTAERAALRALLDRAGAARPPALRRALTDDALLATDLPLCADADAVRAFAAEAEQDGWTVRAEKGWLLLDRLPAPRGLCPARDPAGEAGCCISLLSRHPGGPADPVWIRRLLKAAEEGPEKFDQFCAELHGTLAALLRQKSILPGGLLPYLTDIATETEETP